MGSEPSYPDFDPVHVPMTRNPALVVVAVAGGVMLLGVLVWILLSVVSG